MRWLVAVLVVAFSAVGNVAVAEEVSSVSAFTAGVKPVGQRTYAWGRTSPGAVVATQVQLEDGRWSTSQKSTASASGAYKIPLTYGWNRVGRYRWRVVANAGGAWVVSEPFTLTRTNFRVGNAGVKPVGQTTFAWGVTAPNATVSAQVRLPNNRWSTSQTRTADGAGRFTVPMTYGQFELGRRQWRIVTNYRGAFVVSESFTLTRVHQGATVPKDCSVVVEGSRVSLAASQRSVTVVRTSGTRATVTMVERKPGTSCGVQRVFRDTSGRIGYGGAVPAVKRRQGTGTTPQGTFTVTEGFGLKANPGTRLPYRVPGKNSYWVLDSRSAFYNQWRESSQGGFRTGPGERLRDFAGQYDYSAVINYNRWPAVKGKGGAIFLHVHGRGATGGCVSITETNMKNFLRHVSAGDTITIK